MNPGSISNATRNEKVFRSLGYTLVFLMMACAVMTISSLIRHVLPGWHAGIVAGMLLFIVIDRLYTYRQLRSLTPLSSEWVIAFGAQWMLIVLLTRFLLSYANGVDSFRADLSLLARGYISELFTPEFVAGILLALLAWYVSGQFLDLLDEIGLDQSLALQEGSVPMQSDAEPAHQRLVSLIFSLGIGLVIVTALARIDYGTLVSKIEGLSGVEFNRFSGAEAGALLYFVFGLALLSLSRLMSLQTHWNRLRIPVSSNNLVRQWGIYSLFFLLILAGVVSLLPAGDSLGFFSLLGTFFGFLFSLLFFIGQLFVFLIALLFSLPMLLLLRGDSTPRDSLPAIPPLPPPPMESAVPPPGSAAWALIRSIFLWGSLLAIVIFVFIQFMRQHEGILAALRKSRVANWLTLAWQWLYRNADKARGDLARALTDGWQSILSRLEGKRILPRPGWISLRSLDPRRRIYFFYLAMVRRGAEQGLARQPSQTPSEYAVTLEKALPSAGDDIDSITGAFIEARYSRQEVSSKTAELVRATWGRIRRALQGKAKSERSANQ
ncbi:MAG TPA: DUF4129 domain-containing protein [Anaerolineales bacterium]|nr:DUF4129 domain-containing protein [Anaerolineales bacterium]